MPSKEDEEFILRTTKNPQLRERLEKAFAFRREQTRKYYEKRDKKRRAKIRKSFGLEDND